MAASSARRRGSAMECATMKLLRLVCTSTVKGCGSILETASNRNSVHHMTTAQPGRPQSRCTAMHRQPAKSVIMSRVRCVTLWVAIAAQLTSSSRVETVLTARLCQHVVSRR